MSLLDTLQKPPAKRTYKVTTILAKVTEAEREALVNALATPSEWSAQALADTLSELVQPIAASSIKRYRKEVLGLTA